MRYSSMIFSAISYSKFNKVEKREDVSLALSLGAGIVRNFASAFGDPFAISR